MASGHVNRTKRPNTWLHRPACGVKKVLANLGAVHTWHEADMSWRTRDVGFEGVKRTRLNDRLKSAVDPKRTFAFERHD
jgi:hypothetical protein